MTTINPLKAPIKAPYLCSTVPNLRKLQDNIQKRLKWSLFFPSFFQRQQKLQRERLMNDFSAALNNFQVVQRRAAEKEKESVARARAGSRVMVTARLYIGLHDQ